MSVMSSPPTYFRASWRVTAISLSILCLGLVATVITIGFIKGVDGLSTIALTLAVIAFIAQLLIFVIQTNQSGSQLREAQQLNTQTLELLSEVRTRVDTTYQMVSTHNDVLMRLAHLKAEVSDAPVVAPAVQGKRMGKSGLGGITRTPEAVALIDAAMQMPAPDVIEPWIEKLEGLSDSAIASLTLDLLSHLLNAGVAGADVGLRYGTSDDPLIEAGLVEKIDTTDGVRVRMTPDGLATAPIFAADWPPPPEYDHLRRRLRDLREKSSPSALAMLAELRLAQ